MYKPDGFMFIYSVTHTHTHTHRSAPFLVLNSKDAPIPSGA